MESSVEPLSVGMQVGLRVPVILIGLAGVLMALLLVRRLGALSGILAAAGSLLIAADQAANIAWVLHVRSLTSGGDLDIDTFNTVSNAYLVADAMLITIGVALVVVSLLVRKPSSPGAAVAAGPGFPPAGPGFGLPPGPGSPASGFPTPGAPSPGFPAPGAASPGFPSSGAASPGFPAPGATSPGFPSSGATSPGFPAPGATSPGSPAPGAPSPGGQAPQAPWDAPPPGQMPPNAQ
ncbi:hypothetical protein [Dactylosporangium sp. CA-233914]|uniref:hypothetical protein n=1 Tax=Dactylosporangium sp. CA-233914 TaxID=3239934 RepID=UPI003D904315